MKVRYTPEAIADLQSIQAYIKTTLHNPTAAKWIAKVVLAACGQLSQFPKAGMSFREKTGLETELRVLFCEKYLAVYRIENTCVSIARILDARQDYCTILLGD